MFQSNNIKSFSKLLFKCTYHAIQEVKPCRFICDKPSAAGISTVNQVPFYSWSQPLASNTSCGSVHPAECAPVEKCHLFPHHSIYHTSIFWLHLLTLSLHFYFKLSPHLSLSLSLSPCSLCLYWFCGSVHSMLLALFDRGSEMESQSAKWNQSLFFSSPPSLCSFAPLQQARTPSALNLRVWNELSLLWLSSHLCALSLVLCSPSLFFFSHLPALIQFDVISLCYCQK